MDHRRKSLCATLVVGLALSACQPDPVALYCVRSANDAYGFAFVGGTSDEYLVNCRERLESELGEGDCRGAQLALLECGIALTGVTSSLTFPEDPAAAGCAGATMAVRMACTEHPEAESCNSRVFFDGSEWHRAFTGCPPEQACRAGSVCVSDCAPERVILAGLEGCLPAVLVETCRVPGQCALEVSVSPPLTCRDVPFWDASTRELDGNLVCRLTQSFPDSEEIAAMTRPVGVTGWYFDYYTSEATRSCPLRGRVGFATHLGAGETREWLPTGGNPTRANVPDTFPAGARYSFVLAGCN